MVAVCVTARASAKSSGWAVPRLGRLVVLSRHRAAFSAGTADGRCPRPGGVRSPKPSAVSHWHSSSDDAAARWRHRYEARRLLDEPPRFDTTAQDDRRRSAGDAEDHGVSRPAATAKRSCVTSLQWHHRRPAERARHCLRWWNQVQGATASLAYYGNVGTLESVSCRIQSA